MRRLPVFAAAFVLLALPVSAQQLTLEIQDGRVTLDATSVPLRQILAEWGRVGGTRIVGADKITGGPLTLKLVSVSERQALDILLRSVAGYMAAPRNAQTQGVSVYDRILILPTSSAPVTTNATTRLPNQPAGTQPVDRRVAPRPPGLQRPADADENAAEQVETQIEDTADTGVGNQPVFTFPQPQGPNQVVVPVPQVGFRPGQPGAAPPPVLNLQQNPNGQPTIYNFIPTAGGPAVPPPQGGFQVIGAPQPGMIQQPVQPAPGTVVPPTRPPGQ